MNISLHRMDLTLIYIGVGLLLTRHWCEMITLQIYFLLGRPEDGDLELSYKGPQEDLGANFRGLHCLLV
jgi:hypothetical protein